MVMALLGFIRPADVDMDKLRSIVSVKLMMDRRRTPASWKQRQQKKEPSNAMIGTLIMYGIMGLFAGVSVMLIPSLVASMILVHSYLIFMLIMTMITDFSTVLLENTDAQIITPKPVSGRTIFMSRAAHIFIYMSQLLTAIMIFPVIFAAIHYGIAVLFTLLLTILLSTLFSVFLTYILYGLVLQWSSEQKVKDIISYFQIFMTIFFAVGYQVIPRMVNLNDLNFDISLHWYSYLLPPVWMALFIESIHELRFDQVHLIMIACAVVIPITISWLMVKFLAPYFSTRINSMQDASSAGASLKQEILNPRKSFPEKMAAVFCISNTEKAGFLQTWRITARDKTFKMQFYPGLAYIPIFIFIFVFKNINNFQQSWNNLSNTNFYILFIYLGILTVSTAIMLIPYHENYQAGWVYQSAPVHKPGNIVSGATKSLLVKYFGPLYLILSSAAIFIWGIKIVDDLLLGVMNNIFIVLCIVNLNNIYLPFSMQPNIKSQSGKFVKMLLQFIIMGILILLHYLALRIWWLVPALIPVMTLVTWWMLKRIQQFPWSKFSI